MINRWKEVDVDWEEGKCCYTGTVIEAPIEKDKSVWCNVALCKGQNVYLYIAKDSFSQSIKMGEQLMFYTQMRKPDNDGLQFDYASYLLYKGVSGTAYVPLGAWQKLQKPIVLTWKQRALQIREKIVNLYKSWGIDENQVPVLSALTVGYKGDLSDDVRDKYSVAGISHVLALSGMHVGFLWMMLNFLFKPLNRKGWRLIKYMITAIFLCFFAFIAGWEVSVTRAVIMCLLMEFAALLNSKSMSMNTLAIAASLMLVYNPFYLFDVGFQLSFLALLSILLFYNYLYKLCRFNLSIVRRIWSVLSVSMAAQLGTAPLVMYYFSNFSVYFLLANIVVAMLVPCIIYTTFFFLLINIFTSIPQWMITTLDEMVKILSDFACWIVTLPYASFSIKSMSQVEVWGLYLLIGIVWWYCAVRKRIVFIAMLATIALWLLLHCCLILK